MAQKEALENVPAVVTPWGKLISFKETYHNAGRHDAMITSSLMQVLRIVEPDYAKRAKTMCDIMYDMMYGAFCNPDVRNAWRARYNIPEDAQGSYIAGLQGDWGDELQLMAGRVQEFTPERVEKELDTCPWDICGSELCRATIRMFTGIFDALGSKDEMAVEMVEAKGWGDLHCRVIAERRDVYDRPWKESWQQVGPALSEVHFTPREECFAEPTNLRNADGKYVNYFGAEWSKEEGLQTVANAAMWAEMSVAVALRALEPDAEKLAHIIRCVFEASGKMAFAEFAAIKGVRDWLGVPGDVNDGRVLGGLVSTHLQTLLIPYEITEFTPERTVLEIEKATFLRNIPEFVPAYGALYRGMAQTFIDAEWNAEFAADAPEDKLRLVIERKVDKFR